MPKSKIERVYLTPVLSKALDGIEPLQNVHAHGSVEDACQETNVSKTGVYRILKTLVHRGYVAQTRSGLYRLVP